MNSFPSKVPPVDARWIRLCSMNTSRDPPNYGKRLYEGNPSPYPVQKMARLQPPNMGMLRPQKSSRWGPASAEPNALDIRSRKEPRTDSLGSSAPHVSETWRTNDKVSPSRNAGIRYERDNWVGIRRQESPERKVVNAKSSYWSSDTAFEKKTTAETRGNYFVAKEEEKNEGKYGTEQKKEFVPPFGDSDVFVHKKKENYDDLTKVVMGSINPEPSPYSTTRNSLTNGKTWNELNKEELTGSGDTSLRAQPYEYSKRLPSDSFDSPSLPSSLGGKDLYRKNFALSTDVSATSPLRSESWRNLSSTQPKQPSKPVVWSDSPAVPSDSWRTSMASAPKTESWRNVSKNTLESNRIATEFPGSIRRANDDSTFVSRPGLTSLAFDRAAAFGRNEYAENETRRNLRR